MRGNRDADRLCRAALMGLAVAAVLAATAAQAATIDVFSVPNYGVDFSLDKDNASLWRQDDDPSILGGQRDMSARAYFSGTPPASIYSGGFLGYDPDESEGYLVFSSSGGYTYLGTRLVLQYDGLDTEDDDNLNVGSGLNYNLRADGGDHFGFRFGFIDGGDVPSLGVKISVVGTAGGMADYSGAFAEFAETEGPKLYQVQFSDFAVTGSDPFADAASITIELNPKPASGVPEPNVDFQLLDIRTTPEPSTLFLGVVGVLLMLAWRRFYARFPAK